MITLTTFLGCMFCWALGLVIGRSIGQASKGYYVTEGEYDALQALKRGEYDFEYAEIHNLEEYRKALEEVEELCD